MKSPRNGGEPRAPRGGRAPQSDRPLRGARTPRSGPAPGVSYVVVLLASGRALAAPPSRRRVLITDGPFAETREHLG